ncbi:MAG: hypothetical protein IKD30_01005 [Peptococcaceae bacterium]|nr:hypothetical protein [Peptococcaceae bacterium]
MSFCVSFTYSKSQSFMAGFCYECVKKKMGSYTYDETNRMVKGVNDAGEQSYDFFNRLFILLKVIK